jgi:hypothetical protein
LPEPFVYRAVPHSFLLYKASLLGRDRDRDKSNFFVSFLEDLFMAIGRDRCQE